MRDSASEDIDEQIAERWGQAYTEAQQVDHGDRDELDILDRPVSIDVGRAWIAHARENVHPTLEFEQFESLKAWYATEVRQLNDSSTDQVVPATARELAAATRLAIAFARCELCETVQERHIERAKQLGKQLVAQNWDGERFDARHTSGGGSQKEQAETIYGIIDERDRLTIEKVVEQADTEGIPESKTRNRIEKLLEKGELYEPEHGVVQTT